MIKMNINVPEIQTDMGPAVQKSLRQSALLVRRAATLKAPYKTGTLRRSIKETVGTTRASVGTNLVYAAIHEYGGTIRPKNKKVLRFKIGGRWVTTKKVNIKARPYMRPALEENQDEIQRIFARNIGERLGN